MIKRGHLKYFRRLREGAMLVLGLFVVTGSGAAEPQIPASCREQPSLTLFDANPSSRAGPSLVEATLESISRNRETAHLLRKQGHYVRAERIYEAVAAATIARADGGVDMEVAASLEDLALITRWMSRYQASRSLLQCAMAIRSELAKGPNRGKALNLARIADIELLDLGLPNQAKPKYEEAMLLLERSEGTTPDDKAYVLTGLAHAAVSLGDNGAAERLYRQGLDYYAASELCRSVCSEAETVRDSLGRLLLIARRLPEAEALLVGTLEAKTRLLGPNHDSTATTVNSLANLYRLQGKEQLALEHFRRAAFLVYQPKAGSTSPRWATMSRFAEFSAELASFLAGVSSQTSEAQFAEAIFFFKLSVVARQTMRSGGLGMDEASRAALTRAVADPYYRLAGLLSSQGRLAEAEEVLLALKDDELAEFTRGSTRGPGDALVLTAEERRLTDELNAIASALGTVYAELDSHRAGSQVLPPDVLLQREGRRDLLQQQLVAKLDEASSRLRPKDSSAAAAIDPRDTRLTRLVQTLARKSGESSILVMYVPEERITTVLVTGSSGPTALQLPVGTTTLDPLIDQLRVAIREKAAYQDPSRALYKHLVAPVEAHLKMQSVEPKTLMLYLTGRLRYLPFATLIGGDGKHLVERYRLAVLTAAAREHADADPMRNWSVTAFGSTQALPSENLPALPYVTDELNGIVRTPANPTGTLPGRRFVDHEFTRDAWQSMLNAKPDAGGARRSVIHVATHFLSRPGDWSRSFLLLGQEARYEISELEKALSINLDDVDLLTLSACATELTDSANGREFEGLGAVFQKKGARAVIGTLWPVQDAGGAALMKAFYAARGEQRKMSKAAALQDAQIQLLSRKTKASQPGIDLSHPYYWAPFILMGNWL